MCVCILATTLRISLSIGVGATRRMRYLNRILCPTAQTHVNPYLYMCRQCDV